MGHHTLPGLQRLISDVNPQLRYDAVEVGVGEAEGQVVAEVYEVRCYVGFTVTG